MRSVFPMRTAKIGDLIVSAALCVLGVLLILNPGISATMLGILCGTAWILFGSIRLVGYFSKDLFRLAFQYDLAFGILMIVLGIITLTHPGGLMTFLCIALGLSIFADGLFKMQIAVDARRFGIHEWWLILTLAITACVFGLLLMFRPGEGSRLLGVLLGLTLLSEGLLNFGTMITAVKIIKHQRPDVIDVEICKDDK